MTAPRLTRIETSLGPPLVHTDALWTLDLAELPILHGLSVLSRALAEAVVAQVRSERIDVAVERKLRPRENPELIEHFGVDLVKVAAEHATIESAAARPELVEARLRALLGSLQRQRFRDALFPPAGTQPVALVAEFAEETGEGVGRQRFLLEHVVARHDAGRGSLRITIEGCRGRRIDLASLPHLWLERVEDRHFIAGSTRIAQTWTEALRREAARGRRSFVEQRDPHSHLFRQLDQAGLGTIQRVSVQWSETALPFLMENEPALASELLKRVLLALEDRGVRHLLADREVVRVDAGAVPVFLDIAQLGRVLELSLGQRRERADADAFLLRMPVLQALLQRHAGDQPLRDVPVFLVHHMTGEVTGLIAALRALGCRDLTCLFVTYAGEPPASYLDAVLDLPADEFRALALVNVPQRGTVEGAYRLSQHYSQLEESEQIVRALANSPPHFLDAMRAAAVVPFLRQIARAEAADQRCLLVEDGGYLGPVLHEALLCDSTVGGLAGELGHEIADERSLRDAVGDRLLGTVEHTRNGFDRLVDVERRHGHLLLPAYSIAISHCKRAVESREVAASVLNAVEAVLHADGRILSRRSCLVLGSRGAIGLELCRSLHARLDVPERQVAGIDIVLPGPVHGSGLCEGRTLAELPEDRWLQVDLVIGVTGASVLTGADIEHWLVDGERDTLVLASGSTKKIEFRAVMQWFEALLQDPAPRLRGRSVAVAVEELLDPRTARVYGHRWRFAFADEGSAKTVLALGNLTPINFLFYGVATEVIDEVLAQLLSVSLAAVRHAGGPGPWRLLAVDRDIDADGAALAPSSA
ncbi:MAG TPA: hypothetical protein VFZ65_11220 [Planctomycetota bacterium]|nr:hypothetical protein [Planctomycetota bacterium]